MNTETGWDRRLWGVEFKDGESHAHAILVTGWHRVSPPEYDGAPTRPLLFT